VVPGQYDAYIKYHTPTYLHEHLVVPHRKESGDRLSGGCLHAGYVLEQPKQMTISRIELTQLYKHSVELIEQATRSACLHTILLHIAK